MPTVEAPPDLAPWEPDPSWHAARQEVFVTWRDMPKRKWSLLAEALGRKSNSHSSFRRWAEEDGWAERVAAWDLECDRRRREEFEDSGNVIARQQARDAARFREALMAPADALVKKLEAARAGGVDPFKHMSSEDLVRLTATAGRAFGQVVAAERLAHGMSTENVGGHDGGALVPPDVEGKGLDELKAYLVGRADERKVREAEEARG